MGRGQSSNASGANLLFGTKTRKTPAAERFEPYSFEAAIAFANQLRVKNKDYFPIGFFTQADILSQRTKIDFDQGIRITRKQDDYELHLDDDHKFHREDGPAFVHGEVSAWFKHGKHHRLDGPAYSDPKSSFWYFEGKYHRDDGPAYDTEHVKIWYHHGSVHRLDGPAHTSDGFKWWYQNDELHRTDGPAFICKSGKQKFYLNGVELSKRKWKKEVSKLKA